jgi:ATP-dependent DNA helicase PIF1
MRVVLQANLDPQAGLVNGAQGTIIDFEPFAQKRLPVAPKDRKMAMMGLKDASSSSEGPDLRGTHAAFMEKRIQDHAKKNDHPPWPIVQFDNGLTKTIYPDSTRNELGNTEPYSILSRTQVPLMAGYAITVHKSQGMTLERVIVDLARAFEPSQMYVARKLILIVS